MTPMTSISSPVRTALCMRAVFLTMLVATVSGCSNGNTTAPPPDAATSAASSVIGPAGGTLTGPDGVQVVIPAGALNQPTTIGIARSSVGAPAPLQAGNAPAGPIYEFTPHDLVFSKPVTIRMPVPVNGVSAEVFMASLGADWQVNNATLVGGFAEWQRNSFSFGLIGLACAPSDPNDPYPCVYPKGHATAIATSGGVITQITPGNWQNNAGSWVVNQAGTVSLTLNYQAAPDCSAPGGTAPSGLVRLIRWNPAVSPRQITTVVNDVAVSLTSTAVTPPPGTFSSGGGSTTRGVGSTTVDVSTHLTDATNAFGFSFSCQRPGRSVSGGGDLITIIGPMAAPGTTITIGGTVSGLTGTVVLQNNSGDNQIVTAPNNSFTFAPILAGTSYGVSVFTQPAGQTCIVTNGSGINVQANVSNVAVSCTSNVGPVPLVATSIAAGYFSSLAVASDGTVWAWGQNVDPSTGGYKSTSPYATQPVQVQSLADVKAVALSSESGSFYALHNDGTVSAWGQNANGQLGDHTFTIRLLPVKVLNSANTPIDEVCSIAAGANMLLMARDESCSPGISGILSGPWIVGQFSGQNLGGSSNGTIAIAVPGLPAGVAVSRMSAYDAASGGGAVFFRLANGSKYVWGNNGSNRLGAGTGTSFAGGTGGPVEVSFFWSGTCCTELGRNFSVTMDETSRLAAVGSDLDEQLGNGASGSSSSLLPVSGLTNVTAFSAGQVSAAAITSGQLWVWGTLGFGPVYNYSLPTRLGTGTGFTQVSVGDAHGLAIGLNGEVYSWGEGNNGALGNGATFGSRSIPAVVMRP